MITATTAKILLFIGLTLGPANPASVFCTSHNETYNWTTMPSGWHLTKLGFPPGDFTRDHSKSTSFAGSPAKDDVPAYITEITSHDWSHDSIVVLSDGSRVEKKGDYAFYIVNAGGPNEKDFTISYPTNQ
jgi:hypothetical protein